MHFIAQRAVTGELRNGYAPAPSIKATHLYILTAIRFFFAYTPVVAFVTDRYFDYG
jgi:hypothetical protein